jgi:NAD(P)-dependent dehydrogenase (short-subunit alcohol dehydrogenase family)
MPEQQNGQSPSGLTVLVTGCSSGFGELIAKTLASDGHRVYATMRGVQSRNAGAAASLRQWAGERSLALEVLELDVTDDDSVQWAIGQALASAGGIDVVVNNAGASAVGPLEAFSIEQMASLLSLNVLGPMRVNNAVLPTMRARGSGLIIWITSTLGRVLPGRGGLYPATKWAAEGFAESLHYQVAPFGIDVAIVEPGSFPTPATSKSMEAADQEIAAAYAAQQPTSAPARQPANAAARQPTSAATTPPAPGGQQPPDPQEVADVVKRLIELPAGQRPLRTVVGPVFTEGVAAYNETYEQVRANLAASLRRPDQAITWTRAAPAPPAR